MLDDAPLIYLPALHRTLARAAGRVACVVVVPGIRSPARRKAYTRAVTRLFGAGYALKLLWRFLRAPFWTYAGIAQRHGVPVLRLPSVGAEAFRACLRERGVTAVLSATAEIYKRDTLSLPGVAFYNFHASLLPGNKGLLPLFWAFMNDAPQGVTVHAIDEGIDTGATLFQELLEGARSPALPDVTDVLVRRFPEHVARAIAHLDAGRAPEVLDVKVPSSYGPIPSDDDIRAYHAKLRRGA